MKTNVRAAAIPPIFAARTGSLDDAIEMSAVAYHSVGIPSERASEQCARILAEPFGFSVVVTRQEGKEPPEIVGVENAILIKPWLYEELMESYEPYVHDHIRNAQQSPFPNEQEVGIANAGEGHDLLLAHFAGRADLEAAEAIRVRGLMVSTFTDFFAGNRVRSILVETAGPANLATALGAGFQIVKDYGRSEGGPWLLRLDLARTLEIQNFHLARLLQYRPPLFRFPPGGREVLRFAIQGLTDGQVTERHGITASSLASRWSRLFDIVEEVLPELFAPVKGGKTRERLPLLAYVRNHPEELWPYTPES